MKKIIIAVILVALLGGYIWWSSQNSSTPTLPATSPSGTSAGSETTNPTAGGDTSGNGSVPPATSGAATYKDGTWTGTVSNSVYGPVQVAAVISGGKITDITFLQKPDAPGHTTDVSAQSTPVLRTEAIASQSATVDIVSGATQTSQAFEESLQSALTQAQA